MKRLFLSAVFAISVMVATAQTGGTNATTRISKSDKVYLSSVSTSEEIRQLAIQMELNEGQYIKLRDLYRAKNAQVQEINNMYANDAAMRQSKLAAINQDFEKQLAQTVSQSQFSAYLASQGRAPVANPGSIHQAAGYGGQAMEGGAATGTSNNGGVVNPSEPAATEAGTIDNTTGADNEKIKDKRELRKSKMKKEKKVKE